MVLPVIRNARPDEARAMFELSAGVYGSEQSLLPAATLRQQMDRFPAGVFVAELEDRLVAYAVTLRLHRSPDETPLSWLEAIGGYELAAHRPDGRWLYGVDFGVHPGCRGRGIGSRLYQARFELVKRLNLRGFYAGGMLAGFHRYPHLTLDEYAGRVRQGEIKDPTVTMQLNRGFKAGQSIRNYAGSSLRHHSAMLIRWSNPGYQITSQNAAGRQSA